MDFASKGPLILPRLLAAVLVGVSGISHSDAQSHLGSLAPDGSLHQEFELGQLPSNGIWDLTITLKHRLAGAENPRSEYHLPQLLTTLVSQKDGSLRWQTPSGETLIIAATRVFDQKPTETSPGLCAYRDDDSVSVVAEDLTYLYRHGALSTVSHEDGRSLTVHSEGSEIVTITRDSDQVPILAVRYDDEDLLAGLLIGARLHYFKFDPESEQLQSWTPPGIKDHAVHFSYMNDLISEVAFPDGQALTYTWTEPGKVRLAEHGLKLPPDPLPVYLTADTNFHYVYGVDSRGVHAYQTNALGQTSGWIYNPLKDILVDLDPTGTETTTFYQRLKDGRRLVKSIHSEDGETLLALSYDKEGRVTSLQEHGMAPVSYRYDAEGRITEVHRLDQLQKKYQYEGNAHQPSVITDAVGNRTEIRYRPDGQVTWYRAPDGGEHHFEYQKSRLIKHRYPLGYEETWDYDSFGRLTKHTRIDGRVTENTYTGSQLTAVKAGEIAWDYRFDDLGRQVETLRNGKQWQAVERQALAAGKGEQVTVKKQGQLDKVLVLDAQGNLQKERDAIGKETRYKRGATGELLGWTDPRGVIADFEKDALGRVTSLETAHGRELDLQYDNLGRLRRKKTGEQDIHYRYDDEGRLTQIDYGKGETIDYTYDQYGRMLTALTG